MTIRMAVIFVTTINRTQLYYFNLVHKELSSSPQPLNVLLISYNINRKQTKGLKQRALFQNENK